MEIFLSILSRLDNPFQSMLRVFHSYPNHFPNFWKVVRGEKHFQSLEINSNNSQGNGIWKTHFKQNKGDLIWKIFPIKPKSIFKQKHDSHKNYSTKNQENHIKYSSRWNMP